MTAAILAFFAGLLWARRDRNRRNFERFKRRLNWREY